VYRAASHAWNKAVETAEQYGHRNSQATVVAPTGTISFMMDCETTGIEPELFLVKTKDLVGGGTITIENRLVGKSLQTLGYTEEEIMPILTHLREKGTIEGAPGIQDNHLPVFDCAIKATNGTRYLSPMAHVTMMAAVQPFISGSISKTVNVPQDATKEDFFTLYFEGWRLGLKSLALYREGSKAMTIYRSSGEKKKETEEPAKEPLHKEEARAKHETTSKIHVLGDEHDEMETEHRAIIKPFKVATTRGRLIVGVDSTGHAKEMYIEAAKVGSAVSGHLKAIGISISKGLRAGVPLRVYVDALSGVSFEPSGFTDDPEEPVASSIISYCMRWMAKRFPLNGEPAEYDWGNIGTFEKVREIQDSILAPEMHAKEPLVLPKRLAKEEQPLFEATQQETKKDEIKAVLASSWNREYTFFCSDCGNFMKPTGTNCFTCTTCGTNTGCG
jgi:ribonucleoside-diphosphate reductase alpha chain